MTALDTSVAIAASVEWHEFHESSIRIAANASIPAHALIETYSVLTRLPAPYRLDPTLVRDLLDRRFGRDRILTAPVELQQKIVGTLADSGVSGGASYDGLVGLIARSHRQPLVTCDARAAGTYERLGVDFELITAHR